MISVVSLIWLNLAMLPCAMALESDHNCPECPPEQQSEMASHHDHEDTEKGANCSLEQSDCCQIDQLNFGDRGQKSDSDSGEKHAIIAETEYGQLFGYSPAPEFPTGPPDPDSGTTRLHALFCVYLV